MGDQRHWTKPLGNGQYVVAPGKGEAFVQSPPIGRFHGVGQVTEAKMKHLDIHTGEAPSIVTHHDPREVLAAPYLCFGA